MTYLSSSQSGRLTKLWVHRGQYVQAHQLLFHIDQQPYYADMQQAVASVKQAEGDLGNLLTGQREPKLAQVRAEIAKTKDQLTYARQQLIRNVALVKSHSVQQQELDLARRNARSLQNQLAGLRQKLASAKLPGRPQQIVAAQAAVQAAEATLARARWVLKQTTVTAPVAGEIFDNYYWPGEQVPVQRPVVSLLVPSQIRVVFFVPEPELNRIRLNEAVSIATYDGKMLGRAIIDYISPQAEYTPPVIYSRHNHQKLIYRIEAKFATAKQATAWHPGQPIVINVSNTDG